MKKFNLQKISKTITSLALVCMLILGYAASVSAAENNNSDVPTVTPEIVSQELGISLNEAENLEQNLNKAVAQLPDLEVGDSATVPVSENLVLEAETHDDGQIMNPLTANYAQTECQFRYCGTAIPFLTVQSTVKLHHSVSRIFIPFISRRYVWCLSVIRVRHASA